MDWGFCVFANDMEDAAAVFDAAICPHLLGLTGGLSTASSAGGAGAPAGSGPLGGLANALGRLMGRAHSELPEGLATPVGSVSALLAAGGTAGALGAAGASAASEPSSPMLGALLAAHSTFFQQGPGAGAGAAGSALGSGAGSVKEQLPDNIRAAPGTHKAHEGDHYRVPSLQMGLKPW
jgi:hypothetical protein